MCCARLFYVSSIFLYKVVVLFNVDEGLLIKRHLVALASWVVD